MAAESEVFASGKIIDATAGRFAKLVSRFTQGEVAQTLLSPDTAARLESGLQKSITKAKNAAQQVSASSVSVRDTAGDEGNRNRAAQLVTAAGKIVTSAMAAAKSGISNILSRTNANVTHGQTNARSGEQLGEIQNKARHGHIGSHDRAMLHDRLPHKAKVEARHAVSGISHRGCDVGGHSHAGRAASRSSGHGMSR